MAKKCGEKEVEEEKSHTKDKEENIIVRGPVQFFSRPNLGFWPYPPSPLPESWATKNKKMFILHFTHITFSWKNPFFWLGLRFVEVQYPHKLIRYCHPHLCIVCFITFLAIYQGGKICFGQFYKNLLASVKPPPLVGAKSKVWPKKWRKMKLIKRYCRKFTKKGRIVYFL